jgi:hypothetical protein
MRRRIRRIVPFVGPGHRGSDGKHRHCKPGSIPGTHGTATDLSFLQCPSLYLLSRRDVTPTRGGVLRAAMLRRRQPGCRSRAGTEAQPDVGAGDIHGANASRASRRPRPRPPAIKRCLQTSGFGRAGERCLRLPCDTFAGSGKCRGTGRSSVFCSGGTCPSLRRHGAGRRGRTLCSDRVFHQEHQAGERPVEKLRLYYDREGKNLERLVRRSEEGGYLRGSRRRRGPGQGQRRASHRF